MIFIFALLFCVGLLFFILPSLSPVPYFPSNHTDTKKIMNALYSTQSRVYIDLGAGDGWVVFQAASAALARNLSIRFILVEINPLLCAFIHFRRFFHQYKRNIQIVRTDLFTFQIRNYVSRKENVCVYLYISPWMLKRAIRNIRSQVPDARFVTYMYPLAEKAKKTYRGIHTTYVY